MTRTYAKPLPVTWRLAAVYGLFLTPSILGAVFAWPSNVTLALWLPTLAGLTLLSRRAAKARGIHRRPWRQRLRAQWRVGAVTGVGITVISGAVPSHFYPLACVLFTMFLFEPIDRALYRRRLHSGG